MIDTAGYEDEDPDTLPGRMRRQTEAAVGEADVALFLVDARAGIMPLDEEIARWLRSSDTPIVLAANMSLGINLLQQVVEEVSRILDTDWDIEIVEMRHRAKIDAPSGTALALGGVATAVGRTFRSGRA